MTAATPAVLRRLIGLNGYAAYMNTLVGNPAPVIADENRRSKNPVPGDLVLETSTFYHWAGSPDGEPGPALGWLLRIAMEPVATPEEHRAMLAVGDYFTVPDEDYSAVPTEEIVYVRPLDGERDEFRWHNASFIRVHSEPAPVSGRGEETRP